MVFCKKCNTEKDSSEFYNSSINKAKDKGECKLCVKNRVTEHRWANVDEIRAYDRARGNRQGYGYTKEYRDQNPYKYKAHSAVNNAIRDGRIKKDSCEVCGEDKKVHAHHDDYAKPLEVRWLCAAHHRQWHVENGSAANSGRPF